MGRASGPVLQSVFLVVLAHSAMSDRYRFEEGQPNLHYTSFPKKTVGDREVVVEDWEVVVEDWLVVVDVIINMW